MFCSFGNIAVLSFSSSLGSVIVLRLSGSGILFQLRNLEVSTPRSEAPVSREKPRRHIPHCHLGQPPACRQHSSSLGDKNALRRMAQYLVNFNGIIIARDVILWRSMPWRAIHRLVFMKQWVVAVGFYCRWSLQDYYHRRGSCW